MKKCLASAFAALCFALDVWASGESTAVAAARKDLAQRLDVPVEQVVVDSESRIDALGNVDGCVRVGVPLEEVIDKGTKLVLIAEGQKHYYYAQPGETYRYCELPSTKKRGPIGPPVR